LPNNCAGLKGLPIAAAQPVHAGQNEALDRGGNRLFLALFGIAQELLEEKRIAGGAIYACRS
jgi:hypothetical protein